MKLEKGCVSERGLMFSVFCFMQGAMLRSAFVVGITENDTWAMAFTGLLISLLLVAIYAALFHLYPQKNLYEINEVVFGPVLGKAFSILYLFFFLSLAALNSHDLGDFVVGHMMPETPLAVVILLFVLVCVYAIRKGMENLLRLSTVLCILGVGAVAINSTLMLKDIQVGFLKPFFQLPLEKYIKATVTITAIPMGEIVAFAAIVPMLGQNKKVGGALVKGLILSGIFLAFIILRDIVTLGPLITILRLPSYEAVRYINIGGVLTRMESLHALILISLFLFKVCVLMYASVLGLAQLLNFKSYSPLTLICGAAIFFYALIVFEAVMENVDWGATTAPFFSLSFEFVLPTITLVVASIKNALKLQAVQG